MIYVSISTIPQRLKNLNKSVESLLKQAQKPDKIFINIPFKYKRFSETIEDDQIPKFDNNIVEITRCEDCHPGRKRLRRHRALLPEDPTRGRRRRDRDRRDGRQEL